MGQEITSLGAKVLEEHGIVDYTERFREVAQASSPGEHEAFSGIINQDKAISEFTEALSLKLRGKLNLGAAGVGKSVTTKELLNALRALDEGKDIHGPYAPAIKAYHKVLIERPRGDILSLWNPLDYTAPIIFRTQRNTKSVAETLEDQTQDWIYKVLSETGKRVKEAALQEATMSKLSDLYKEFMVKQGVEDFFDLSWTAKQQKSGVKVTFSDTKKRRFVAKEKAFNAQLQAKILDLTRDFERENVMQTVTDYLSKGAAYLQNTMSIKESQAKEQEKTLRTIIEENLSGLSTTAQEWESQEPKIAQWYRDVAKSLGDEQRKEQLIKKMKQYGRDLLKSETKEPSPFDSDSLEIKIGGREFPLLKLFEPEVLFTYDSKGLVIREPTVVKQMELFAYKDESAVYYEDKESDPVHKQISIGDLAYADLVVIDDELASMVANNDMRRALLTFLEDGQIRVMIDKVQVKIDSDCHIIANETVNPFFRQVFEGTDPKYDEGMARRFSVVQWPDVVEHSDATVRSFPRLLEQTVKQVKDGAKGFEPAAMNLLYHSLLADAEPLNMLPMQVGTMNAMIFERLLRRAHSKGHELVTADDVIDFFWSQRDHAKQRNVINSALIDYPMRMKGGEVGQANAMALAAHYGTVARVNAILTHRLGKIESVDTGAKLTDETYNKGVLTTDAWMQHNFGPFSLETLIRMTGDGIGGNSATSTQTYAVMSALGDIPIDQRFFITGNIVDGPGNIGAIGGVYEKARGAMLFAKAYDAQQGKDPQQLTVMVPPSNIKELLRKALFDREMQQAMEEGVLTVATHETVWDGFSQLSGSERRMYESRLQENIRTLQSNAAEHAYRIKEAGSKTALPLAADSAKQG